MLLNCLSAAFRKSLGFLKKILYLKKPVLIRIFSTKRQEMGENKKYFLNFPVIIQSEQTDSGY